MNDHLFQWSDDFITGVESIDNQHFSLIEIINDILKLCFQNEKIQEKQVTDVLARLENYTFMHFESEEKIMLGAGVDPRHAENHIQTHREFIGMIQSQFSNSQKLAAVDELGESVEFLIRWLAYHILNMDKNMVQQMNLIQSGEVTPAEAYEKTETSAKSTSEPLLKALKALFYVVSEKNKELEKKNEELEEKVKLRTQELQQAYQKLEQVSLTDDLTSLPNRRYALQEIQRLIHNRDRYEIDFSVLFIDLDRFKPVNDTFGHETGDQVLKWIASFLQKNTRKSDIPCRLGGDEFIVICEHTDYEGSQKLAENLNQSIEQQLPENLKGIWKPSLSIGVAEANKSIGSASHILSLADEAMYRNKNSIPD